jgi:hypothetical protein
MNAVVNSFKDSQNSAVDVMRKFIQNISARVVSIPGMSKHRNLPYI